MSTTPKARATDPETSHEAALRVTKVEEVRSAIRIILLANPQGLTDYEIQQAYDKGRHVLDWPWSSDSGLRTRRSELVHLGEVAHGKAYKETGHGRRAIVWKVVR